MGIERRPVRVSSGESVSSGEVETRTWEKRDRAIRALKATGVCFLIGIAAIGVPVLHFLISPLFFLIGLVAFPLVYLEKRQTSRGEVRCPKCEKAVKILSLVDSWPIQQICPACEAYVTIEPTPSQS